MQTQILGETETFEQLMTAEFPSGFGSGLVEVVPQMEQDVAVRQRAAQFIGACVAGENVSLPERVAATKPIESLFDAIQLAAEGDNIARKMVEINVRTDVIERTIKAGHVTRVDLDVDEAGVIRQHGQSMESVQANSLRLASNHPHILERTKAETTNSFRIQQLHKSGDLEDYYFVVFSRAADGMTNQEMKKAGFFVDTMSCAIQATTADKQKLSTESAFVAGTTRPDGPRHDKAAVKTVAKLLGQEGVFDGLDDAQTIETPLLVHKNLMPNGVIDLVKLYDQAVGDTFFGQKLQKHDYLAYKDECKSREDTLEPKVQSITNELVAVASSLSGPVEACQKLAELSERHMVEQAVFDRSIDARVFGAPAAIIIEQARRQFEEGNLEAGLELTQKAIQKADSNSCPGGLKASKAESDDDSNESKTDKYEGDCEFVSKECPVCHKKNVKTKVTKNHIKGDCKCVYDKVTKTSKKAALALAA